jgi:hypothetical protein
MFFTKRKFSNPEPELKSMYVLYMFLINDAIYLDQKRSTEFKLKIKQKVFRVTPFDAI